MLRMSQPSPEAAGDQGSLSAGTMCPVTLIPVAAVAHGLPRSYTGAFIRAAASDDR